MLKLAQRFLSADRGNAAMIFGLSVFGLAGFVGVAIDLSLIQRNKAAAQDALDSAVLAAAIINDTDEANLKKTADAVFARNLGMTDLNATITAFKYDSKARTIKATASGTYNPIIMKLFGYDTMPYSVVADSIRAADGTLEVALVLDNTWSMSATIAGGQQKIAVLKTAAQTLVSTIMTKDNKDFVKVAVVPYADYVNVGTANRNASWMSVAADYTNTPAKTCKTVSTANKCKGGYKTTCTRVRDGISESYDCWKDQICETVQVTPYQSCSGGNPINYKFYGCVRNQMKSSKLVMPDPTTPYVGIVHTSQTCLNPILPLSNDSGKVAKSITDLAVSVGNHRPETYIPAGLIWGVNTLSPPAPFVDGKAYDTDNKEPRKTIVLMTDGANTLYSKPGGDIAVGNATQVGVTYADQLLVCDYAKAKKIEIYTIGFDVSDTKALNTLKSCATSTAHYFDAKSPEDLIKAFETIGGKLSTVRLTR